MTVALRIRANVKSLGAEPLALSPALMILGDMGAGKSSWIDALAFNALGYHPRIGRGFQPVKDSKELLSRLGDGAELDTEVTYDTPDGRRTVSRRLAAQRKDGELTFPKASTLVVSGGGGKPRTGKDAEAEVARLIGEPLFLDQREWLSRSDDRRTTHLLRYLGTDWTAQRLWEALAPAVTPADLEQLWQRKDVGQLQESAGYCRHWEQGESIVDWLQAQYDLVSAAALMFQRSVQGITKALEQAEGAAVEPHMAAERKALLEGAKARRRQTAEAYAQQRSELHSALGDVDRQLQQRAAAQRELLEVQGLLATLQQPGESREGLEQAIASFERGGWGTSDSLPALRSAVDLARSQYEQRGVEQRTAEVRLQTARETLARVVEQRNALAKAEIDPEVRQAAATARASVELLTASVGTLQSTTSGGWGMPRCPTCDQRFGPEQLERSRERLAAAKAQLEETREREREARAILESQRGTSERVVQLEQQQVDLAASAADQAREAVRKAEGALSTAEQLLHGGELRLKQMRSRLASLDAAEANRQQQRTTLLQREASLHQQLQQPAADRGQLLAQLSNLHLLEQEADALAASSEQAAERSLVEVHRLLERQQLVAQQAASLEEARAMTERCKEIARELGPQGLQARLLAEATAPLTEPVNAALEGLGLGTFSVRLRDERGRPCCQPGLVRNGSWTHLESLSGGESAIVLPLFLAGLACVGRAPWRLVAVDGVEQIPLAHRNLFLDRLQGLLSAGRIDQVIVTGCPDTPPTSEGYQVVQALRVQR